MIIVEEDLDLSTDFFGYFQQLVPLLDKDDSIYCISAWNDQVRDGSGPLNYLWLTGHRRNTHLTSLTFVSVRHHGRVTQWKSKLNLSMCAVTEHSKLRWQMRVFPRCRSMATALSVPSFWTKAVEISVTVWYLYIFEPMKRSHPHPHPLSLLRRRSELVTQRFVAWRAQSVCAGGYHPLRLCLLVSIMSSPVCWNRVWAEGRGKVFIATNEKILRGKCRVSKFCPRL